MASINVNSNNTMYLAYRFAGPSADLIVPAVALYAVALVGIVLNAAVLVVTVKPGSTLRGTANILMALLCLFELTHQIGHTFFLVVVVSGTNFVSLLTANIFMTPMIFAVNCSLMAMFCAALDRLFVVALPNLHSAITLYKCAYLLLFLFICLLYGVFTLNYVFVFALENSGNPTTGFIAETLLGSVGSKFFVGAAILSLSSACCYVAIFVIIRCQGVTQQTNNRLLRSMVIILSISIGGYLINLSIYRFLDTYGNLFGSEIRIWQFGSIFAILLNIAAGSNAVVLYYNSTEYRIAFEKEKCALTEFFGIKKAVVVHPYPCNQIRNSCPNIVLTSRHFRMAI